jgi:hypothetical protein
VFGETFLDTDMVKYQNGTPMHPASSEEEAVKEAKSLICEICRNFYKHGWVSGTGGGMSIKVAKKSRHYTYTRRPVGIAR